MTKLHKREYTYKHEEKTLDEVTLEQVKKITGKHLHHWHSMRAIVRDNGRLIVVFRTDAIYEQMLMDLEHGDKAGDEWYQYGTERKFSWSDDYDNYTVTVAELWTSEKFEYEEGKMFDDMANHYYGVKEDTGRYSIYDVYSEKELL